MMMLLSVACADGVFEPIEQDFIQQFAMHGDLLEFINNEFELSCKTIADVLDFANSANGDSLHLCLNQFTAS